MVRRSALLIAALLLSTSGCSDDGGDAKPVEPVATVESVSRFVVQFDASYRLAVRDAAPCLRSALEGCTTASLATLQRNAVNIRTLTAATVTPKEKNEFFVGTLPPSLKSLYGRTLDAATSVRSSARSITTKCLPRPQAGCRRAQADLDEANTRLLKALNRWRELSTGAAD